MAKDPALPGPVSRPEGGTYPSSEKVREADAVKAESISEILDRPEVINLFGEKIGQQLLDGGFSTIASTLAATDKELEAVKGVGEAALKKIRELAPPKKVPESVIKAAEPGAPQAEPVEDLPQVSVRVQRIRDSQL